MKKMLKIIGYILASPFVILFMFIALIGYFPIFVFNSANKVVSKFKKTQEKGDEI